MGTPTTLYSLIAHTLPNLSPDEVEEKEQFERYVLESTLGRGQRAGAGTSRGGATDEEWRSVVEEMRSIVLRRGTGSSQSPRRLEELASQLRRQTIPRDKLASLSFLLSLANSSAPTASTSAFPLSAGSSSQLPRINEPRRNTSQPDAVPVASRTAPAPPVSANVASKRPMTSLLASHRAQATSSPVPPVPESVLIRDIIYILQGINGQYVRFKSPSPARVGPRRPYARGAIVVEEVEESVQASFEDGIEFVLDGSGYSIPAPTRALLHELSELGWLYRKIDQAVNVDGEEQRAGRVIGMVEQSLHAALKDEMTEYYRLVAVLEGQWEEGEEATVLGLEGGLTLRRLVVWTADVRLRVRMMGTLVEEAGELNVGGALLTTLHSRTSNGDPFIRDFSSRLLKTLSVPFFSTLASWIYEGELRDPFSEFFVELNPAIEAGERGDHETAGEFGEHGIRDGVQAHELWEGKFEFRSEMLPGFLEEAFGRKIFSTGKSLNFIKYSCQDSEWVVTRQRSHGTLQYADMAGLERSITLAYSVASQRLFDIFFDKFRLLDHLKALKDYLMLGKGDFVEILMENLGPSLSKPANTLYRHNLTATLELAIRGSSSSSHPDTLRRLDARMLEFTQGELGWDVFTLEYKVDAPLDTVLDPECMEMYLKMFKHLWQVKRVEYSLTEVWRRLMTNARSFRRVPEMAYQFHQTRIALSEMIFFIRQLQYYIHLEVIACSWQVLEEFVHKKEGDLDSLVEAHRNYLKRLVSKALLIAPAVKKRGSKETPVSMLEQVRKIFKVLLQYREAADSLCNHALSEASRALSTTDAQRGLPSAPILPPSDPKILEGIQGRVGKAAGEFRDLTAALVGNLGQSSDLDLRFLSVRLNFNYSFVNPNKVEVPVV